jgi:hypothetical protein
VYPLIPRQDQFEVEFFQLPIEGRTKVMNFPWPGISLPVLGRIFVIALLGTVIAGTYGVLHDQLTLTISPEYFTKFKIHQFHYLGDESGSRIRVAKISFLATWWVGFFAGWFMGRILVPRLGFRSACSFSLRDFLSFSWALLWADYWASSAAGSFQTVGSQSGFIAPNWVSRMSRGSFEWRGFTMRDIWELSSD